SGAVWASADAGMTPGSVSAAASRAPAEPAGPAIREALSSSSVAATATAAYAVASAAGLLAGVDVIGEAGIDRIGVELHRGLGEIALLPGFRRLDARAPAEEDDDRNGGPAPPRPDRML